MDNFNMRLQQQLGQLEKPHRIRENRKDVARIETILTQRNKKTELEAALSHGDVGGPQAPADRGCHGLQRRCRRVVAEPECDLVEIVGTDEQDAQCVIVPSCALELVGDEANRRILRKSSLHAPPIGPPRVASVKALAAGPVDPARRIAQYLDGGGFGHHRRD